MEPRLTIAVNLRENRARNWDKVINPAEASFSSTGLTFSGDQEDAISTISFRAISKPFRACAGLVTSIPSKTATGYFSGGKATGGATNGKSVAKHAFKVSYSLGKIFAAITLPLQRTSTRRTASYRSTKLVQRMGFVEKARRVQFTHPSDCIPRSALITFRTTIYVDHLLLTPPYCIIVR